MLFASLTLDLDITYVMVLALVIIPFVVLNGLVFQPFLKLFDTRHERVVGELERADKKIDEAEAKAATFEERMKVATRQGIEARDEIRTAAQKSMSERIEEERKKLGSKVEAALAEVGQSRTRALEAVNTEAKRLAEMTAAKLLGRGV